MHIKGTPRAASLLCAFLGNLTFVTASIITYPAKCFSQSEIISLSVLSVNFSLKLKRHALTLLYEHLFKAAQAFMRNIFIS